MAKLIARLYDVMDKSPLRALSLVLALLLAGCMFWEPSRFAAKTSPLYIWQGLLMMWAVCTGVIHGVGFRQRRLLWRTLFSPLLAQIILVLGLAFFFL
ncbi:MULTISPECIES: cyd operon protein YbgE [Winslowiella]|uniref:cyd operon protein YbgE n=1 Tax=Winslowiella TaxID=2997349 RepID=UPI0028BF0CCE|nr:cyd operon protein YbgE [Winslowiella toletana]WNN45649.1 cyd operon protein YbgE [Winslowiella toletana]